MKMKYKCTNYAWGEIYESDNRIAIINKMNEVIHDCSRKVKKSKIDENTWEIREVV